MAGPFRPVRSLARRGHPLAILGLSFLLGCKKGDDAVPPPSALAPASTSASASASASTSASTSASALASPSAAASASASASALASASASAAASASPAPSLKTFPGTESGARSLLAEFVKPTANTAGLSAQLRPTTADYKAIFDAKTAAKLEALYSPQWEAGTFVVAARPGQSTVLVDSATVPELKAGTGPAKDFPSGYKIVASHLVGAARLYRFRFVEPGKELGNAYDGLAHVNGHWVLIPKPWRGLDDHP